MKGGRKCGCHVPCARDASGCRSWRCASSLALGVKSRKVVAEMRKRFTVVAFCSGLMMCLLVGGLACFLQPAAFAQETTASMQGVVKDQTGAVVPNATVVLSSPAMMGTKTVKTDQSGSYRFADLPPGEYTLTVTSPNFRTWKLTKIDL